MPTVEIQTETVPCDLCGESHAEELFVGRDLLHHTPGQWPVVQCQKCNLVRVNPRPAPQSLNIVYPADYSPYRPKIRRPLKPRQRRYLWSWRHHWNYPSDKPLSTIGKILSWPFFIRSRCAWRNFDVFPWRGQGRLLDIGCGGGAYLLQMEQYGWHVQGMDFSQHAVNVCRQQGFNVQHGVNVEELFAPGSFDVITLWHVLEHVPQPSQTLTQIRKVLADDGRLVLAVPNFDSWCARRYQALWFGMELPRHIWHFTPATITAMLDKTGFGVERCVYPKFGQTLQNTMNYIARERNDQPAKLFANSKRLCMLADMLERIKATGPILVIHARKKS